MNEEWFVYEISEGSFRAWFYWGIGDTSVPPRRREIGPIAKAIIVLSKFKPDKNWFDSAHEYWTTSLPGTGIIVAVRPETNPFAEGYIISKVQLPWLEQKSKVLI